MYIKLRTNISTSEMSRLTISGGFLVWIHGQTYNLHASLRTRVACKVSFFWREFCSPQLSFAQPESGQLFLWVILSAEIPRTETGLVHRLSQTLFQYLLKNWKVSSHQLNSKNNGLISYWIFCSTKMEIDGKLQTWSLFFFFFIFFSFFFHFFVQEAPKIFWLAFRPDKISFDSFIMVLFYMSILWMGKRGQAKQWI